MISQISLVLFCFVFRGFVSSCVGWCPFDVWIGNHMCYLTSFVECGWGHCLPQSCLCFFKREPLTSNVGGWQAKTSEKLRW